MSRDHPVGAAAALAPLDALCEAQQVGDETGAMRALAAAAAAALGLSWAAVVHWRSDVQAEVVGATGAGQSGSLMPRDGDPLLDGSSGRQPSAGAAATALGRLSGVPDGWLAAVPAGAEDDEWGIIVAARPQRWDPDDAELLLLGALGRIATHIPALAAGARGLRHSRDQFDQLVRAGLALGGQVRTDDALEALAEAARSLIGADYAAIGVLEADRTGLERFVTAGVSAEQRRAIGDPPRGRGLLGALIHDPQPLRVVEIGEDPRSAGFPPHHPPMSSFLGVPLLLGDEVFGNLYLTDKRGGAFDEDDERVALTLAAQASVAVAADQRQQRELEAERERMEDAAATREAQAHAAASAEGLRRAIEAQEGERARIARELHDEAGQGLTALALHLRSIERDLTDDEARERVAAVRGQVGEISEGLRALAADLRPPALREHGLAAGLERLVSRLNETTGIGCHLAADGLPSQLRPEVEVALYRVVQETLTNIARHSGASQASVVVSGRDGRVRVVVEDDGRGFDPGAVDPERLGLAGMRERVRLIGGRLGVESSPGAGTVVLVDLGGEA